MKQIILIFIVASLCSCGVLKGTSGGTTIDSDRATQALVETATAFSITDAQIITLSQQSVAVMDKENQIEGENTPNGQRLARLTKNLKEVNGVPLNFKVYKSTEINAFACADGSIRIYSALMEVMDDDELMGVIGHEIGHIAGTDVKDAMKNAYITSAALHVAGSVSQTIATLTDTQLGAIIQSFVSAQFSQKQEYAADEYGFKTCIEQGYSPYGMANSLNKLVTLSKGSSASALQKMFSSHPDSEKRAVRMKAKADQYTQK